MIIHKSLSLKFLLAQSISIQSQKMNKAININPPQINTFLKIPDI